METKYHAQRVAATCGARRRRKEAFERHGPTADESPALRAIRYREATAPRVKAVETRGRCRACVESLRSATVLPNLAGSMAIELSAFADWIGRDLTNS